MIRWTKWKDILNGYKDGYLSSNGVCFDVGRTSLSSLRKFEKTRDPYSGPTDENTAGNGSLMRVAPVPLFYANNPKIGISMSGESSRTTHQALAAIDACRYLGALIIGVVNAISEKNENGNNSNRKEEILSPFYSPIPLATGIETR